MFRITIILLLTGLAVLLQTAAEAADSCAAMKPGTNHITVISGGRNQNVDLVLPRSFAAGKRVPLVIGLHPSGGTGVALDEDTGLGAAATAKGFAVMFPDGGIRQASANGEGYFWNIPGVPLVSGAEVPGDARDDVRFIADIIDHVVKNNCVDARRVYVTGFSGGARMSSMVACRLADRVAAVAPVGGLRAGRAADPEFTDPDASDCRPSRPVSVLAVHGTDDQTNPYPGGGGLRWGYSVERALLRWAILDKCTVPKAVIERISAHVASMSYASCGSGTDVKLYQVDAPRDQGGGHIWPGGRRDLSGRAPPAELDATEIVLKFFAAH
jgi:polyhydroxybutyrate depolymerase